MFGRATITLGIGPHSSLIMRCLCDVVHGNAACHPGKLTPLYFPVVTVSRDRSVVGAYYYLDYFSQSLHITFRMASRGKSWSSEIFMSFSDKHGFAEWCLAGRGGAATPPLIRERRVGSDPLSGQLRHTPPLVAHPLAGQYIRPRDVNATTGFKTVTEFHWITLS